MKDNKDIIRYLRTARGQIDGVIRMIEDEKYCIDVSNQIMAAQAILKKANHEILRNHMNSCVKEAFEEGSYEEKIDEIISILGKCS